MNERDEYQITLGQFAEFVSKVDPTVRIEAAPKVGSFREFLEKYAMVPGPNGTYQKFTFKGREPLIEIVRVIDMVLGNVPPDENVKGPEGPIKNEK
jgi:hypothetical protein